MNALERHRQDEWELLQPLDGESMLELGGKWCSQARVTYKSVFEDMGILDRVVAAGGLYPPSREDHPDGSHVDSPVMTHTLPTPAEPYGIAGLSKGWWNAAWRGSYRHRSYSCIASKGDHDPAGCERSAVRLPNRLP